MCGVLTGCTTINSVGLGRGEPGNDSIHGFSLARIFHRNESFASDNELQTHLLLRSTPGSYVVIADEAHRSFAGILLRANKHEFQLLNCVTVEVVQNPDGQACAKRIQVPLKSFKTSSLTSFSDLTKIAPESVSLEHADDVHEFTPDTIVFTSGRQQRWVEPLDANAFDCDAGATEQIRNQIARTAVGSQVSFIDVNNQRFNGILVDSESGTMELMSCVSRDIVPGPDGQEQIQTSHVPFRFFPTESIKAFAVVSPPPPDFDVAEFGLDHTEYFIAEYVSQTASHHRWGLPHKCNCVEEQPVRCNELGGRQ